jgi:hypothetical protein
VLFSITTTTGTHLYVVDGSSFHGFPEGEHPFNRLYRNDGGSTFADVTAEAGVGDTSWSMGCVAADYDNDGSVDLFVANLGRNRLYRNLGGVNFEDVTERAGVGDEGYGTSGTFGDYDLDGDLDLYVSNYVEFSRTYRSTIPCVWKTYDIWCGPRGLLPQADVFYRAGPPQQIASRLEGLIEHFEGSPLVTDESTRQLLLSQLRATQSRWQDGELGGREENELVAQ